MEELIMKQIKIFIFLVLAIALLFPATAYARDNYDDRVVVGGTFTLESGETHQGSLAVFGGAVTTEPDSTVNGDVVLVGGTVELGGTVNGNVVGIGGAVRLTEDANINGDVVTIGATLRREDGAVIDGQVVNGMDIPFSTTIPNIVDEGEIIIPPIPQPPTVVNYTNPFLEIIWFFFRTFLYAALAVLLVMFLSSHIEKVADAAINEPVISAGAGLLTAVLGPLALIAITITIILIPVTLVAVLLLIAAWLFGWVALGFEVGRRIANALKIELAPAISAGIGTLVLLFVLGGINQLIPCIGWIPQTLVGLWGLGAVLMTRFGTQKYPIYDQPAAVRVSDQLDAASPEAKEITEVEDAGVDPDEDTEPSTDEPEIPDDGLGTPGE
jgi:hypothetical protein